MFGLRNVMFQGRQLLFGFMFLPFGIVPCSNIGQLVLGFGVGGRLDFTKLYQVYFWHDWIVDLASSILHLFGAPQFGPGFLKSWSQYVGIEVGL